MKILLGIAAIFAGGYQLWAASQISRLAATPPTDPAFDANMFKMKSLDRNGKLLAVGFFIFAIGALLTGSITVG